MNFGFNGKHMRMLNEAAPLIPCSQDQEKDIKDAAVMLDDIVEEMLEKCET